MIRVAGHCPTCGQRELAIEPDPWGGTSSRSLICVARDCPDPTAADKVLADGEVEHIVTLEEEHFHIQHPLRERIDGELFACPLHAYLASLDSPPVAPGRFRVAPGGDEWTFEELSG